VPFLLKFVSTIRQQSINCQKKALQAWDPSPTIKAGPMVLPSLSAAVFFCLHVLQPLETPSHHTTCIKRGANLSRTDTSDLRFKNSSFPTVKHFHSCSEKSISMNVGSDHRHEDCWCAEQAERLRASNQQHPKVSIRCCKSLHALHIRLAISTKSTLLASIPAASFCVERRLARLSA